MMRRTDFDTAAARIQRETAGEWEAQGQEGLYGEDWIVCFSLFYKGQFIACCRCRNKTADFVYETAVGIIRACYLFDITERVAA